jgi:hypothetical protein
MATAHSVPDVGTREGRRLIIENFEPWVDSGALDEVWFDNANDTSNFGPVLQMINWIEARWSQVRCGIEAYPHTLGSGGVWPQDIVWGNYVVPMLALSSFIEARDPEHELSWDPDRTEVHMIHTPHAPLLMDDLNDYRSRGYIVGSGRPWLDWGVV